MRSLVLLSRGEVMGPEENQNWRASVAGWLSGLETEEV